MQEFRAARLVTPELSVATSHAVAPGQGCTIAANAESVWRVRIGARTGPAAPQQLREISLRCVLERS